MDILGGLLQALLMLFGFAMWVLPIAIAVWILVKMSTMSRDMTLLKRQLNVIAEHSGAPIVPQPPQPRGVHAPLWAFGILLVVFLVVMVGLYALPGLSFGSRDGRLMPVGDGGGSSSSSFTVPLEEMPALPEPEQETPAG